MNISTGYEKWLPTEVGVIFTFLDVLISVIPPLNVDETYNMSNLMQNIVFLKPDVSHA